MGFSAAGFFGQVNANITDQKQYIRARVEEDRLYLREQGLKRQGAIQEQRGQYEQAARSLITRGADESIVMTTLEMDPAGLMEVFRRTDNRDDISGNGLNDLFNIANEYRTEATMDEVLNSVLPTVQEMPNDTDPVTSRRRSIASWLGLDVDEAMTNQVYSQQIVGGMTGDQIMAGMNLPVQAQGSDVGGVNFDFSGLSSSEVLSAQDVRTHLITANEDYNLTGMIDALKSELTADTDPTDAGLINSKIQALEAADSLSGVNRLNAVLAIPGIEPGPNTRMLADRFGERLFDPLYGFAAPSLVTIFGRTEGDTSDAAVAASGDPDPNAVAEAVVTPEVTTSAIPSAPVNPEAALAEESRLKDYYGVSRLTPSYELESLDELETMTNNAFAYNPEAEAFLFKVDDEEFVVTKDDVTGEGDASVFEGMSQVGGFFGGGRQTTLSSLLDGATLTPPSSTPGGYSLPTFGGSPSAPPESVTITPEEATADQRMLTEALRSDDITPEELNAIAQGFADKYGEEPLTVILDQVQNTSN
jgi:hypothetical protein